MANAPHHKIYADEFDTVVVAGRFEGGAAAATKDQGGRWSVAHSSTGNYAVTFSNQYKELVSFVATVTAATEENVDTYSVVGGTLAAGVLPVITSEGGTVTDLAANEFCNFIAVFRVSGN